MNPMSVLVSIDVYFFVSTPHCIKIMFNEVVEDKIWNSGPKYIFPRKSLQKPESHRRLHGLAYCPIPSFISTTKLLFSGSHYDFQKIKMLCQVAQYFSIHSQKT